MLKNKCCLYVIISIRFFSITICNLLIEFPSYFVICYTHTHLCSHTILTTVESVRFLFVATYSLRRKKQCS